MAREGNLLIENARIIFRNFSGKEGKFNREGDRNFCVLLDEDVANKLVADGWNVKSLRGREEGDAPQPYLQVTVSFKNKPPKITIITHKGRTPLGEDELEILDWVDIENVDLIINPYNWTVQDKGGIKAYLKSIFVKIYEDELDIKYADLDELPARAGRVDE